MRLRRAVIGAVNLLNTNANGVGEESVHLG
jgi:hypothetical protein